MNRRNTLPANSTPNPSEIHVARRLKGAGGTNVSQTNSIATPTTARMADIVSTPAPAMSTTLTRTSAQANEVAPSTAGPTCAKRKSASAVESLVTMGSARWREDERYGPAWRAATSRPSPSSARLAHVTEAGARHDLPRGTAGLPQ